MVYTSSKRDNSKCTTNGGKLVRPKGRTNKDPQAPEHSDPCPEPDVSGEAMKRSIPLLLLITLFSMPAFAQMKVIIQYQDQFGQWKRYGMSHHEPSAYKTAKTRAERYGVRYRLVDENGRVLDIISP